MVKKLLFSLAFVTFTTFGMFRAVQVKPSLRPQRAVVAAAFSRHAYSVCTVYDRIGYMRQVAACEYDKQAELTRYHKEAVLKCAAGGCWGNCATHGATNCWHGFKKSEALELKKQKLYESLEQDMKELIEFVNGAKKDTGKRSG